MPPAVIAGVSTAVKAVGLGDVGEALAVCERILHLGEEGGERLILLGLGEIARDLRARRLVRSGGARGRPCSTLTTCQPNSDLTGSLTPPSGSAKAAAATAGEDCDGILRLALVADRDVGGGEAGGLGGVGKALAAGHRSP